MCIRDRLYRPWRGSSRGTFGFLQAQAYSSKGGGRALLNTVNSATSVPVVACPTHYYNKNSFRTFLEAFYNRGTVALSEQPSYFWPTGFLNHCIRSTIVYLTFSKKKTRDGDVFICYLKKSLFGWGLLIVEQYSVSNTAYRSNHPKAFRNFFRGGAQR